VIQNCRKPLHSRTKENRLVIQIQKALWRKLEPWFSRNKKLYASKEVKLKALASEGKSCRPETKTTVNRYVCHDLSVWNKQLKSITSTQRKCRTFQSIIYLAQERNVLERAAFWHELKVVKAYQLHRSFRLAYPLIKVDALMADAKSVKVERSALQNRIFWVYIRRRIV